VSVLIDLATGDPEAAAKQFQTAGYRLAYLARGRDLVEFESAGHIYRLKATGEIVPGVTTILKDTGIAVDFDGISAMGRRQQHSITLKRDIGTALHADTHAFDDNDLDLATVNIEVRPYLDCYITFRQHYPHLRPALRERLVYDPSLRVAGTLDGIFLTDGETRIEITERWSVQLIPGRKVPYLVTPYPDHYEDAEAFKAFAATWWRQAARRAA
jgi:hypothetical protein